MLINENNFPQNTLCVFIPYESHIVMLASLKFYVINGQTLAMYFVNVRLVVWGEQVRGSVTHGDQSE